MATTSDPDDPRLTHGLDKEPTGPAEVYLVLSEEERAREFVRPFWGVYRHTVCGAETRMARPIAQTYARQPGFYGSTYCTTCRQHRPVGADGEFEWPDGSRVGT